ncbi:MAG: hypothetical protein U1F25_10975 [Rubrivivax sp.]
MGAYSDALATHKGLAERAERSRHQIDSIRSALAQKQACSQPELSIYAAGSLARLEAGRASDLDLFFIGDRPEREAKQRSVSRLQEVSAFADLIAVNGQLGLEPFTGDGQYLKVHELADIIDGTGSSADDSENLFTTRLLLLLESKPLTGDALYARAIEEVLKMYFRDGRGRKDFRPLFILNDILRYWRTLCLNYERDRSAVGKPWWKRNLNLKFPRKLTVFSTVLSIIATKMTDAAGFQQLTTMTPMQRLAFALDTMNDEGLMPAFVQAMDDYEAFLAAKSQRELDGREIPTLEEFSQRAQRFDWFLHTAFESPALDRQYVRFVLI